MCMIAFWMIYYFSFCKSLDFEMMFFYCTNTIFLVNSKSSFFPFSGCHLINILSHSKEITRLISETEEQYDSVVHASTDINT